MAVIAPADRRRLLALARHSLVARVRRAAAPVPPPDLNIASAGAFVSIHCAGDLRGCLGTLDDGEPLAEAVIRLAGDVALHDPRFAPLGVHELELVTIHVSVLTPPEPLLDPLTVVVGRDGLIVRRDGQSGLLLPQVPIEHGWDRETFLAHTCLKAGLVPDAWRNGATMLRFEAEVFGE